MIAKFLSRRPESLVGKLFLKKFLHQIDPHLFEKFVQVVETGQSLQQDIFYQSNGNVGWYHFIAGKLGDGFSVTVRNITERKQMEIA